MEDMEKVQRIRELIYHFAKNKNIDMGRDSKVRGHDMMLLNTIKHLNQGEPIQMSILAKHFKISAPAISQISKRLEKLDYIERIVKDEDRRSVYLALTQKARDYIDRAEATMDDTLRGLVEYLGDQDSDEMIRILGRVDEYISNRRGDCGC